MYGCIDKLLSSGWAEDYTAVRRHRETGSYVEFPPWPQPDGVLNIKVKNLTLLAKIGLSF